MGYKMKGWKAYDKLSSNKKPDGRAGSSAFQKTNDKEYEPQTQTRGYKNAQHTDMTPQTERQKMSITRLEGEIEGIFDNEYMEAKERGDKSAIKRYERQMLILKKEIENKGGKYTHVNMSNFG